MDLPPVPVPTLLGMLGEPPPAGRAEWLSARIAGLAAEGRLVPGTRLPAERQLAEQLGLSRGTVVRALDTARDRGVLASRRGSGRTILAPGSGPVESLTSRTPAPPAGTIDLRATVLPPHPLVAGIAAEVVADIAEDPAWGSVPADGLPALIEEVCRHYERRGLPTDPSQLVITNGAVSGIHLALLAATAPGARVGTENPGYPNSARAIRTARRRAAPIDVDHHHTGAIVEALTAGALHAALLTADFHNPTGTLISAEDRGPVLRAAARSGTPLIIDETLAGMNWRGIPQPPPMHGHGATTLLVGSVSKSLWAGLRIGWIRAPAPLADTLSRLRLGVDLGAPRLEQSITARLLERAGLPDEPHCRPHLENTYAAASDGLREMLPGWRWADPAGGLSIWAHGTRLDAHELAARALARGVAISPGALFSPGGAGWPHSVRIPFSGRADELRSALTVLAEIDG